MTEKEKAILILENIPICEKCDAPVATFTCCECENAFAAAIKALKQPDIVLCKDCKHLRLKFNQKYCDWLDIFPKLDWFCADGERR